MNTIEKIARYATRIDFEDDGETARIVVRLNRFDEIRGIIEDLDITADSEKVGGFMHIYTPLIELF